MNESNLQAALSYAANGWSVFPVTPARGEPGSKVYRDAKRPMFWLTPHGHLDASTDPAVIECWWSRVPTARIGLNVARSGLFVIDHDDYKAEAEPLPKLPPTWTATTPQGGKHFYFIRPEGDWTDRRLRGIDTKGNGYVILPSPESGGYEWAYEGVVRGEIARLPAELCAALLKPEEQGPGPETAEDIDRWEEFLAEEIAARELGNFRMKGLDAKGRVIAELEHCPFDQADHSSPWKAIVGVGSHGYPFAACVVDGCAGQGWEHLPGSTTEVTVLEEAERPWVMTGEELLLAKIPPITTLPVLGCSGYIPSRGFTLLAAFPKVGKTTLLRQLVREWLDAGHRVLYFTEEADQLWPPRLQGPPESWANLRIAFAFGRPVQDLLDLVRLAPEDIVVVDTLRSIVRWGDENSAELVLGAMEPWMVATRRSGKALIGSTHHTKAGGEGGRGITGSGALFGLADVALELEKTADGARRMTALGRLGLAPDLSYRFEGGDRLVAQDYTEVRAPDTATVEAAMNKGWVSRADIGAATGLSNRRVEAALTLLRGGKDDG